MQLKDVMTKDVEVIEADATLADAARVMRDEDIGVLPVLDGQKLIGMITDRDIVIRAVAEGMDPASTLAAEFVTRDVVYGFEDQEIEEAAEIMGKKQIRRLIVLNHEERVVGIVSLGDLAANQASQPGR